jgi:5'-deoxynucleotidase YfbR-like HD superfamily hydrolase
MVTMPRTSPPRVWQRMLSGRRLDLAEPSPLDIEIEDIAHGLARVARWNGQTHGAHAFSVAQHAVMVEEFYTRLEQNPEPRWQLAALLHDAPEYVIGDMISPFKAMLGPEYKDIEKRLMAAVHIRFGLPAQLPNAVEKAIKRADCASAHLEAVHLAGFERTEAIRFFGRLPDGLETGSTSSWPAQEATVRFLMRFTELMKDVP